MAGCKSWGKEWCFSSVAGKSLDQMNMRELWILSRDSPFQCDKQLDVNWIQKSLYIYIFFFNYIELQRRKA